MPQLAATDFEFELSHVEIDRMIDIGDRKVHLVQAVGKPRGEEE